jgi:transposase-like protein
MKRKRHTPSQIVTKLREAAELVGRGQSMAQAAKQLGVSEHTLYRWRNEYGRMGQDDARKLKELERENTRLKKIVAEQAVDNRLLKEMLGKKW